MKARALALVVATALAPAVRPCAAQDVPRDSSLAGSAGRDSVPHFRRKSPVVALALAWVCPGLGHDYTGEHGRATVVRLGAGTSIIGAFTLWSQSYNNAVGSCDPGDSHCEAALRCEHRRESAAAALLVTGVGFLAYGLVDAPLSAQRVNARRARAWARQHALTPTTGTTPSGARYAGASMRFR